LTHAAGQSDFIQAGGQGALIQAGGQTVRRGGGPEQSRARYPDAEGGVERDGVRVHYEVYGHGEPTVLLLPTWSVVSSRMWKMQIPYLARHARVVAFDGRGNGGSDRPRDATSYSVNEFAADALAVLDATSTARAVVVAASCGALWGSVLAAQHPDRVAGIVYIAPAVGLADGHPDRQGHDFGQQYDTYEGWAKYNQHYWRRDYPDFLQFFFDKCLSEAHSTKAIEDCVGWGLDTDPESLIAATEGLSSLSVEELTVALARIHCPALVIHGDADLIRPHAQGAALAAALDAPFVTLQGSGHLPWVRDPVAVNHLLRAFASPAPPPSTLTRARSRPKRALFVSSPIGLGHVRRDAAIASALRDRCPGLEIEWLAQHPVTAVLESLGEHIHPASRVLASESGHFESESAEHDLHCFSAWRRMDEILLSNFMVFDDVVSDTPYDLWIADEAWELDYYLHENPELKRAAYAWLTDFVGWLPMADGGEQEAALTADYNAEMIGHIARYPRLRDRSIFIGDAADVVTDRFGPDLPAIRAWTEQHFTFPGYITGFDPAEFADRESIRDQLGWRPDEKVGVVSVGGTSVGVSLLRRVIESYPLARRLVPELRLIVVTGPRIDPATLSVPAGVEVFGFVPDLYRHLAACDIAVVQGGLSTAMELTASQRPFLYFPLRHHFEQNIHVRHRLNRHRAGRAMDYGTDGPEEIAVALAQELTGAVDYLPIDPGGARRAAALLAEML
jgi:pimeloyl-ACP methyl ester carboxylesterase/predicted glycosyltransferase